MSKGKMNLGGVLFAAVLVGGAIILSQNPSIFGSRSSTGAERTNIPVITSTPSPAPTATPKPVNAYNGQIFQTPDYEGVCGFTVKASANSNHYIYLEYKSAPEKTANGRNLKPSAKSPYKSDLSFFVKAGQEASIQVPVGTYKLYYASGDTFFGEKLLFGDRTGFYASDDYLTFYTDNQYTYGHTVTLTSVVNGNFDTDPIPESQFPGRN